MVQARGDRIMAGLSMMHRWRDADRGSSTTTISGINANSDTVMGETKTYRLRVAISGIELATEHRYTMEQVKDIHRLVKNVAVIAVGDPAKVAAAELKEIPA